MKKIKVVFMAFDRKHTVLFDPRATEKSIRLKLHKICSTYYILSMTEVIDSDFK